MSATTSEAPRLDVRFGDPEYAQNPYPLFELIREAGPVVYSPGPVDNVFARNDAYLCSGHRTCARVLGNVRRYRTSNEFFARQFGEVFESLDTPRHDAIRGVWAHEFERDTLREKQSERIERVIDRHLEPFLERVLAGESVDAVSELHNTIPLLVTLEMLGLPEEDRYMLRAFLADESQGVSKSLIEYVADAVAAKRLAPGNDLISMMVTSDVAQTMTNDEVVANCSQIVSAGSGTTAGVMNSCVLLLAQHPDQRRTVAADRSLVHQAIEEAIRFRSVPFSAPRVVADGDAELEGVRIPQGATVLPLLGAANRDPLRWERPNEFDVLREPRQHLGFGFGMHNCLGLNFGRLVVQIYLNRLLDRIPDWEIAEGELAASLTISGQLLMTSG